MAWNEPGGNGNGQDPWGGRKNNDGPPDLDEALKKFQDKINNLFGGKGGKSGGNSSGGGSGLSASMLGVFAIVGVIAYLAFGIYQLDEKEEAVILRLGKFHSIVGPGLHWNPKIMDKVYPVNVTEVQQYKTGGLMLTEDESIVELPLTVQYNIADTKSFVLNVRSPEISLQQATDSALRHVVGSTGLEQVLSEGRQKIGEEIEERLQNYLDSYGAGINIVQVNIQEGRPPSAVKGAFDDVVKAKEDETRFKNEAQAYANGIVPEARGKAQRAIEEANAYRDQVVAKAEGEAERFNRLLVEYTKAPRVTRERLYIDAIESVMANSSKVLVDVEGGNNMMFLPLDKLVNQASASSSQLNRSSGGDLSPNVVREINERVAEEIRRNQNSRSSRGLR
ncbi:MAG: FtsH protease activity modulator HflK [Cellvibrionaceae bacterium]